MSDKKLSQSMAVLPNDPESAMAGKQPKSLVNKLSHLMKDTKSSAMRNAGNATNKSNYASGSYNTIEGESPMKSRSPYKQRGSPAKSLKPKMGHSKSKGNLKGTPQKELGENLAGAFLLDSSLNFNFEGDVEMSNDPIGPPKEGEMTLEGIDGIVLMSSENSQPDSDPSPIEPADQHSGGAEREFEDQLEEESKGLKLQGMSLSETLDQQAISIDQKGLDDLSKKASFEEMQLSSRSWSKQKERPKVEFDSEIMSIIGSINSKAKEIKDKFNIGGREQEKTTPRARKTTEQGDSTAGRRGKWAETDVDPLQEIALELSKEVSESENEGVKTPTMNQTQTFSQNNLEQTIIIGEMEEGNIFDDLNRISAEKGDRSLHTLTITKDELQDLVDNLKLKHRAEVDAIMLEQTSYKRIIQQMILKFKAQQQKLND